MKRLAVLAPLALLAFMPEARANVPQLNATCPTGITVKVNHGGTVRINGEKAQVKTFNENAWEARHNKITISITKDASGLMVSYTLKGGANGICEVMAEESSSGGNSGTPSQDEQACLQAVSIETNNGDVILLSTETSEANNTVIIGVGEQRAKWKCLVKNGKVAEVMSLTDEGAL